ncbi:unnamed protein product [Penicillium olsonii]|nr:unnamed protein product [Penicillium olsonii]CAG7933839.1 unnamed protein product [Penicillium olsonii]
MGNHGHLTRCSQQVHVEKDPWQDRSVPAHALKWCEALFYQQMTQQTTYQANIIY